MKCVQARRKCVEGFLGLLIFLYLIYGFQTPPHHWPSDSANSIHDLSTHNNVTASISHDRNFSQKMALVCHNNQPCIVIHVFAYRRAAATAELLEKLTVSDYSSFDKEVPLLIHLDRPRDKDFNSSDWQQNRQVEKIIVDFKWPHGPKLLDIKAKLAGLMSSWLTAWVDPNPNDIMIALEDDMDVSPLYFEWLLHVVGTYNLWQAPDRDQALLGISLSPILYDEISLSRASRVWLPGNNVSLTAPVFLHGTPSSWGGVYFGEHWRRFLSFVAVRRAPPFYEETDTRAGGDPNLLLPSSLTNTWVRSWKRFMDTNELRVCVCI